MKKCVLAFAAALVVLPAHALAQTQPAPKEQPPSTKQAKKPESCKSFKRNPDGSWTSTAKTSIPAQNGQVPVRQGITIRSGVPYMGIDLAKWLDEALKPPN